MSDRQPTTREDVRSSIVSSRLLVLQSKRLVLRSTENRMRQIALDHERHARILQLRDEIERAHERYQRTMLEWGSPKDADYWVIAYSRLIEKCGALTVKLRASHPTLPVAERYQLSADVEVLEGMIARWTDSKRRSMVAAAKIA